MACWRSGSRRAAELAGGGAGLGKSASRHMRLEYRELGAASIWMARYAFPETNRDQSRFVQGRLRVVVSRSPKARDQGQPQGVGKRHRNRCHQPKIQLTMYQ